MQASAVRTYYPKALTDEKKRKLTLSRTETTGLALREIHCPYCGMLVDRVFSDVAGHKMVYCRKCKTEYPVNLGYFRCQRLSYHYHGLHGLRQRR